MKLVRITILGLMAWQSMQAQEYGGRDPKAVPVALVSLIANPMVHDNKVVRVIGVAYWNFEGSYLFLTKDHYTIFDSASAIQIPTGDWLLPASREELQSFNGEFVAVEGEFEARGGTGGRPALKSISRIQVRRIAQDAPAKKSGNQ